MLATLFLIRHGEVLNPDHLVYADLPGFGLSVTGTLQANAASDRCRDLEVDAIVSSPLQRAVETAGPIAAALHLPVARDQRLTEWALGTRWAGVVWEDLPTAFPGELEAYLATPTDLAFAPETIEAVANRMHDLVIDLGRTHPGGAAILVSHQDPVQALRLSLTGRDLATLHDDKPMHASVITLQSTTRGWIETDSWAPDVASEPFHLSTLRTRSRIRRRDSGRTWTCVVTSVFWRLSGLYWLPVAAARLRLRSTATSNHPPRPPRKHRPKVSWW